MSELNDTDFNFPPGIKTIGKLIGHLRSRENIQAVAATLADTAAAAVVWIATFDGEIGDIVIATKTVPAAGESMVFDVKKNGTSILTLAKTLDSTAGTPKTQSISSLLDLSKVSFSKGDVFTVNRTYVAGGGPAMTYNQVTIEPTLQGHAYTRLRALDGGIRTWRTRTCAKPS